jgi:beta-lactamase superfamily II metal-dependent hydrolase
LITNPPKDSEVEVTLIGTGGGYGESLVIKVNVNSWIIIDSCVNPANKEPLSIEYLKSINVNLENVKLIVCTHWHNDHIKGLAKTLEECVNAKFCFSHVHDLEKFLYLCGLDYAKMQKGTVGSLTEFIKCIDIIEDRKKFNIPAQCDLCVFAEYGDIVDFALFALSPSPKTIQDFNSELSQLMSDFGSSNITMVNNSPNAKSVALLLKFGKQRVILGADLEQGNCDDNGWRHIIKQCVVIDKEKADLYKLPHHGSENGYLKEIFDVLVNNDGILKVSPYNSSGLPRSEMISTYRQHTQNIFSTSAPKEHLRSKRRDLSLEKFIDREAKVLEIKFTHGIVRSRIDYTEETSTWTTELFEAAVKL